MMKHLSLFLLLAGTLTAQQTTHFSRQAIRAPGDRVFTITTPAGVEQFTFDNGFFGIATNAPQAVMHVNGSGIINDLNIVSILDCDPFTNMITADDEIVAIDATYMLLSSDSSTATDRTFKLDDLSPISPGTILWLQWQGAGAGQLLDDGLNVLGHTRLEGDWYPVANDCIFLIYNGVDFVELSRAFAGAGPSASGFIVEMNGFGTNTSFAGRIKTTLTTLAYSGGTNVTVDWSLGNHFTLTLTNNAKLWFTNAPGAGWSQTGLIDFMQDGSGSRLLYWDSTNIRTNPAQSVVLSTAANAIDDMHVKTDRTGTNFHILLNTSWAK